MRLKKSHVEARGRKKVGNNERGDRTARRETWERKQGEKNH